MEINYTYALNKARQLKRNSFGSHPKARQYYFAILNKIDEGEVAHLVAIAYYRAQTEAKKFYTVFANELYKMGFKGKAEPTSDDLKDYYTLNNNSESNLRTRQLENLYCAIGFELFYKYLPIDATEGQVRKWTWKSFGKRKNEQRISRSQKREIATILKQGGVIRFSKTTSSVYIKNNEVKIRISDHAATSDANFTHQIIINHE